MVSPSKEWGGSRVLEEWVWAAEEGKERGLEIAVVFAPSGS